jgi:uncharacterized protein
MMARYLKLFAAILTATLMLMAIERAVIAGPIEDATAAFKHGEYTTVLRLLRPLANDGVGQAQYELGFLYYNGFGVPQDYVQAAEWYRIAADQGIAKAQHDLGVMYLSGQGVPQDYVLAHMWFNLAGSRAINKAALDEAIKDRDLVASKMTPAQIAEAQRLARQWKPRPKR